MSRPLFDSDAEQAILGALLQDSSTLDRVDDKIKPEDLYVGAHRVIFGAIRELVLDGKAADPVTVLALLQSRSELSDDMRNLVVDLHLNALGIANLTHHCRIVREHATHRELLKAANEVAEAVLGVGGHTTAELVDLAQRRFNAVAEGNISGGEARAIGSVLTQVIDNLEVRMAAEDGISGLATGLTDLDKKLCGLHDGNLIVIAGRPAMGKTTLAMQIAINCAGRGEPVGVFSFEMGADELTERALSNRGRVNSHALRSGKLDDDGWDRISAGMSRLKDMPLYIDDFSGSGIDQVRARARRMKRQYGVKLIVIDYLQLMIRGTGNNTNDEVSAISRGLKLLARELKLPVILLSQLNRKCEERTNKRPMLSDLRDSGAIEQDCDVALFVYRDEVYDEESDHKGIAELLLRKVRMGETGDVKTTFMGEFNAFGDLDYSTWSRPDQNREEKPAKKGKYEDPTVQF